MNVSLNWLGDHVDLSGYSLPALDDLLTFAGIEVERIERLGVDIDHLVVAQILSAEKHPDADKLSVCQVDDGSGPDRPRQIVCGAKNFQVGDKVPLALPGCVLGPGFEIKTGKLRGVESRGMLCSASELGLAESSDGLLILDPGVKAGTPVRELFARDTLFELEITPNRPDCLSHLGVARELAALAGKPLRGPSHHGDSKTPRQIATDDTIRIAAADRCPWYTARVIRGVTVRESPAWLKRRLEAVGLRPINNIVDLTNYVLMEMGQPLHAFDLAKLEGGIQVRPAGPGESLLALDGQTYRMEPEDLVIADSRKAVAIAGVMGGGETGVTGATTDILLEAAYFSPAGIRRTARRLGLHSDSSHRFERGVDPAQVAGASDLAARLIAEIAGGTADPEIVVCGAPPPPPAPVSLDNDRCRRLIGHGLTDAEIDGILGGLGLGRDGGAWRIPSYRSDLERPVDLIEEVARVHGLDRVPGSTVARFSPASKADAAYDFNRKLQSALASLGFHEIRTLKLISGNQLADDRATSHRGLSPVRLKNPLNDEQDHLRPGLVPGLLATAARNARFGHPDLRLFEMGRVFNATPQGEEIEHEHLALLMTGSRSERSWLEGRPGTLDLFDLRGVLEHLIPGLAPVPAEVEDGRLLAALSLEIGGGKKPVKLGLAGYVPPDRVRECDLPAPVVVAELNLRKLAAAAAAGGVRFADLPRFPSMTRDIAMLVPASLPNGTVEGFFAGRDEPLLQGFALFDVFTDPSGQRLAADRKSLAYSLTYRAPDRTLEAAEIDRVHAKILDALKRELPVELRQ